MDRELRLMAIIRGVDLSRVEEQYQTIAEGMWNLLLQESVEYILPDPEIKTDVDKLDKYISNLSGAFAMATAFNLRGFTEGDLQETLEREAFELEKLSQWGVGFNDLEQDLIQMARRIRGIEVTLQPYSADMLKDLASIAAIACETLEAHRG